MPLLMKIGSTIRNRREELGMSQKALAEKVGTLQSEVSRVENGTANVTVLTLYKFCKVLRLKFKVVRKTKKKKREK